jgi:hypothetical protein
MVVYLTVNVRGCNPKPSDRDGWESIYHLNLNYERRFLDARSLCVACTTA